MESNDQNNETNVNNCDGSSLSMNNWIHFQPVTDGLAVEVFTEGEGVGRGGGVTARVWCRGGIDRKRNSTINLTTDSGACY